MGMEDISPERLAVSYAPRHVRPALAALLSLDRRFGTIVRTTGEPMIGLMRLTWWRDALVQLDQAQAPAEPLLRDLQMHVLPYGVSGAQLGELAGGWAVLLDPIEPAALTTHGDDRGSRLFYLAAEVLGAGHATNAVAMAGRGWAFADLAAHIRDAESADLARERARDAFRHAFATPWPTAMRPLGALALLHAMRIEGGSAWHDAMRLIRFRLVGR